MAVTAELSTMVEAEMVSVRVARRFVQTALAGHATPEICSDLMLGTSELVTNAVEYGSGSAIQVTVRAFDEQVSVTVTSSGAAHDVTPTAEWTVAGPEALSGRGLGIVRAVADDVSVDASGGALSITMIRHLTNI